MSAVAAARVSLTMIVKDEALNLADCLEPIRRIVDEIVVCDTGSTDATRELAAALGARVVHLAWQKSFAAARNAALEAATGDWIFVLDADDRVPPCEADKLGALFAALPEDDIGFLMGHVCLGATGVVATQAEQVRLFRRRDGVRWRYRVHEQIAPAIAETGGRFAHSGVRLVHLGFRDAGVVAEKLARNLALCELDCEERPLDPFPLFYRGTMLADAGRPAEAIVALETCRPLVHPRTSLALRLAAVLARAYHDAGDEARALEEVRGARARFPEDVGLACAEAELLVHGGEVAAAGACLVAVAGEVRDLCVRDLRARALLGEIWLELGLHDAAEALGGELTGRCPSYGPGWFVLADALLARGRGAELDRLLPALDDVPGAEDASAVIRAARGAAERGAAVQISRRAPPWGGGRRGASRAARLDAPVPWDLGRVSLTGGRP